MAHWTFDDIPEQAGRRAIVTGSNTGIGFETALALAKRGAHVTLACRNMTKAEDARSRMLEHVDAALVEVSQLDLSDLGSVEAFSARYLDSSDRLDMLILNAGVMVPPESKTAQGYELQFGVNHLGHFALTGELLGLLMETPQARVVVVSSVAAQNGKMNFDDLHYHKRGYSPWGAYGQSKLANQLFVRELQRRLETAGADVIATAAHPGWTKTDLQRTATVANLLNPIFAMDAPKGALPTLRAATDPQARGGDYFGPHGLFQMRGFPVRVKMVSQAQDAQVAQRLWDVSKELTNITYQAL